MSLPRILWSLVYCYSCLVFILSVIPVHGSQVISFQDKIIHFIMYANMAAIVLAARECSGRKPVLLPAFLYAVCFGIVMEVIQYFLPYRSFEFADIAANSLGAAAVVVVAWRVKFLWYKNHS